MDTFTKEQRHQVMSRIRSKNTNPEMIVRRYLHKQGFRFRLHKKELPGKPDMVLPKYKTAIFVHGCFWHAHENCKYYRLPKSNTDYWAEKINKNIDRDKSNQKTLRDLGYRVIIVWECELKNDAEKRCIELIGQIKKVDQNK